MEKKLSIEISIRLATPADVVALTELHCASFALEDNVPKMLGKDYVQATYRWQVSVKNAYTLVAEVDGNIVGLVAVCDGSFMRPMFMACIPEFFLSLLKNPFLLVRMKLWRRLFRRPNVSARNKSIADHPGIAQMIIGAIDAGHRGKSIFPALVEATKTFSKARGSRAIRAGIYKTNISSRRVFIKGGWIETPELETPDTVFYVTYLDPDFPSELGITI